MINLIVAMDRNHVIGKNGIIPWYLPNDLSYFKKVTSGHTVVMGRKTAESIGRPLPNRKNVLLTRQGYAMTGFRTEHSVQDVLTHYTGQVFVIGGEQIYREFMPYADKLYITHVSGEFDGDTYFPPIDPKIWDLEGGSFGLVDEHNLHMHLFTIYKRI
jgi:dihydrofolate reductase